MPEPVGATWLAGDVAPTATEGWRGRLNRLSLGLLKLSAGPVERARLTDERLIGTQLSRAMTVMVANSKGGTGKTPTAAMTGAVLGRHRGSGVLVWDNNENQGTLGDRTQEGRFPTTAVDLLEHISEFEEGHGSVGTLGRFVRHQQSGPFDVLSSSNDSQRMQAIGADEFSRMHAVLSRFFPLMIVDSGNASVAPNWVQAARTADLLIIPVQWKYDHVRSAERTIADLRALGLGHLVDNAITVITHGSGASDKVHAKTWRAWFEENTAQVVDIPFDSHIDVGTALVFDRLAAPTQRAFLALGAAVARQLAELDNPYLHLPRKDPPHEESL